MVTILAAIGVVVLGKAIYEAIYRKGIRDCINKMAKVTGLDPKDLKRAYEAII